MTSWDEIRDWRCAKRAELRSRRVSLPRDEKDRVRAIVANLIRRHVPELRGACIGFCWPYKGEIDFRHFIRSALSNGAQAALPVVVERAKPLEFWSWRPHMKMERGIWNIPVPAERSLQRPTVLLVPLLGFDESGHRLGYGGGYFDRTLAVTTPRPLTIGVGYELGRLETIYPQPHDIQMDAIVTEAGFEWHARPYRQAGDADGARRIRDDSDLDLDSLGYLSDSQVLDLLGQLLEGERAGARGVGMMTRSMPPSETQSALHDIASDEAHFCAMLTRHIMCLGGTPSGVTGSFYEGLLATGELGERLDRLNRGQGWVVRKLREALLRIDDDFLRHDLRDMLVAHERNIATCTQLKQTLKPSETPVNHREPGGMEGVNHAEGPAPVQRRAVTF